MSPASARCLGALPFALAAVLLAATPDARAASITGTVTWANPRSIAPVTISHDIHVCGLSGPIFEPPISVDGHHRLREVVVYLADVHTPADAVLPFREVIIDQRNCAFDPHVAATTRGSVVRFRNSDPVLHNVHVLDEKGRTLANYAFPVMDQEVAFRPQVAGHLSIQCDAGHTWMHAALLVFDHPFFAVTDGTGHFEISLVPPGTHTVVAWHPDLGRVERKVVVPQGAGAVPVDLAL